MSRGGRRHDKPPAIIGEDCGTVAGYTRHLREDTQTCQPCRDANAERDRLYRLNRAKLGDTTRRKRDTTVVQIESRIHELEAKRAKLLERLTEVDQAIKAQQDKLAEAREREARLAEGRGMLARSGFSREELLAMLTAVDDPSSPSDVKTQHSPNATVGPLDP